MSNQRMGSVINARASRRFSAFDRPRKSIFGLLTRFQNREQEFETVEEQVDYLTPKILHY